MRLVLALAQHGASNLDAIVNRQQNPLSKLVASPSGFFERAHGKNWACVPSGAAWRIRNSEGAIARLGTVTCQD